MTKRERFEMDVSIDQPKPDKFVYSIVDDFLKREDFRFFEYKGEGVWKRGDGWLTFAQFIKVDYINGKAHIEAWIKRVLVPGVYYDEMDLKGTYANYVKKELQETLVTLTALLQQSANQPIYTGSDVVSQQSSNKTSSGRYSSSESLISITMKESKTAAASSLALGLFGIFGVLVPVFGIVMCVLGIIFGKVGLESNSKVIAVIGMTLSIIFLVIDIIVFISGFISVFTT